MRTLDRITLKGFKSIRNLENFPLRNLNILIGPNGSGKSNFISFFSLLNHLIQKGLRKYVAEQGGADSFLFFSRKTTPELSVVMEFGNNSYAVGLKPTVDNRLYFSREILGFEGYLGNFGYVYPTERPLGEGHSESKAEDQLDYDRNKRIAEYVVHSIKAWRVYHFHDTGDAANVKRVGELNNNRQLESDAGNLAAFLFRIQETRSDCYERIRNHIRLVAPFFDDFLLRPIGKNEDKIQLEWRANGSDYPFTAAHLSDGSLRFICLATLLLQPSPPTTIIIDEPELGIHPYAIRILSGLMKAFAGPSRQVIASTQSSALVDEFEPHDIVVVDPVNGESVFKRPDESELDEWLQEYTLGQLWDKNVIGGRP